MKITGHKTRSVFDRYNITSPEDLRRAAERQVEYLWEQCCYSRRKQGIPGERGYHPTI